MIHALGDEALQGMSDLDSAEPASNDQAWLQNRGFDQDVATHLRFRLPEPTLIRQGSFSAVSTKKIHGS